MKRTLFFVLIFMFVAWSAWAFAETIQGESNATEGDSTDSSVKYEVDLGNGEGSVLVFGDNNTIYLPPDSQDKENQIQPNEVTFNESRGSYMLVCTETDIIVDGVMTRFSKVVFELHGNGTWELVWFEQGG